LFIIVVTSSLSVPFIGLQKLDFGTISEEISISISKSRYFTLSGAFGGRCSATRSKLELCLKTIYSLIMTLFERLPYDLLRTIFDYLDVPTLLDACLVAHTLNEIASWSLYTSITFNPDAMNGVWFAQNLNYLARRNPVKALERRPHLRNAVRNVTMCSAYRS
jgi:hypothetical protein